MVRTSHETTPGEYEYTCERRGAAVRMPSCAYFLLTSTYLRKRPAKSEEKKISYGCNSKAYRVTKTVCAQCAYALPRPTLNRASRLHFRDWGSSPPRTPARPTSPNTWRRRASKPRPPRRATPTITQERLTRGPGRKEYMLHNELLKAS